MRKFSSVANVQVSPEPKSEVKEVSKIDTLKFKLLDLMDKFLKIQGSGSARTELVNSAISITGKEILADSILGLLQNEFSSEKVSLLESLKLEINDWYLLDNKIDQINSQVIEEKNRKTLNIERKIMVFLDLYGDDNFELHTEMFTGRLTQKIQVKERIDVSESLLKSNKLNKKQYSQVKLLLEKLKQRVNRIYS
jgi:hypothetical protein